MSSTLPMLPSKRSKGVVLASQAAVRTSASPNRAMPQLLAHQVANERHPDHQRPLPYVFLHRSPRSTTSHVGAGCGGPKNDNPPTSPQFREVCSVDGRPRRRGSHCGADRHGKKEPCRARCSYLTGREAPRPQLPLEWLASPKKAADDSKGWPSALSQNGMSQNCYTSLTLPRTQHFFATGIKTTNLA